MIQKYSDLCSASDFSVSGPLHNLFRYIMLPSVCIIASFQFALTDIRYLFLPLGRLIFLYYALSLVLMTF